MKQHYAMMITDSEARARRAIKEQILDTGSEFYGGFYNADGLTEAKYAVYQITTMTAVYNNEQSCLYHDKAVAGCISRALEYVLRVQHDNGLFDYIDCNFFSAPDTAFIVKRLLPAYQYLCAHAGSDEGSFEKDCREKMERIILHGAEGIKGGGFHTPNHRWAIASVLMLCGKLFDRPDFTERARQYLNEGIDCNKDGEYAEKSAGNYNRINNDAMITIGDCTGEQFYYDNAIRNLRMMLTYIEPNGSIFTANSTRQDNGKLVYPVDYYTEYLRMGHDFKIPEFLDMANTIFTIIRTNSLEAPDFLMHLMNRPDLVELEHEGEYHQPDFQKFYEESGICRMHNADVTWTLMKGKSNFLYITNKSIILEFKIGGSFCEHRAFQAETMKRFADGSGYTLTQSMRGWYYLPFENKPDTTDWWKMDNASRQKLHGPNLDIKVSVREAHDADGNGVDVHITTGGVKPAPFRVEISCAGAERVCGSEYEIPAEAGGVMIGRSGTVSFENAHDCITVGPAFASHKYIQGKFGSEKASGKSFTLYFTDYVPFDRVIKIRSK